MTLKERMMAAMPNLTEEDFETHGDRIKDLYVINHPGVMEWLIQNYEHHTNIDKFIGAGDWKGTGKICLDIPFAA